MRRPLFIDIRSSSESGRDERSTSLLLSLLAHMRWHQGKRGEDDESVTPLNAAINVGLSVTEEEKREKKNNKDDTQETAMTRHQFTLSCMRTGSQSRNNA